MGRLILLVFVMTLAACDLNRAASQDGGGPTSDTHIGPADGAASDAMVPACSSLGSLTVSKKVASFHTRKALIDPSLQRAWLISHKDNADGDLYELSIPSAKLVKRGSGYREIAWLGIQGDVIAARQEKGTPGHYALDRVRPGSSKPELMEKDICAHQTSRAGKYLLHLLDCKDNLGQLHLQDSASGTCMTLSKQASRWGFAMSPDATVVAYREQLSTATGCKQGSGTLYMHHHKSNKRFKVDTDVVSYGVQFTRDGAHLLYRKRISCNPSIDRLMETNPASPKPVKLTEKDSYGFFGHFEPDSGQWTLAVNPDNDRVLVADLDMTSHNNSKLVSVRIDGQGEQVLAGDLFNYQSVSAAMRAWAYTVDGAHVVYLNRGSSPNSMGLAAYTMAGGQTRKLTTALAGFGFEISPNRAQVAFLQGGYSGPNGIMAVDLKTALKPDTLHSSAYTVSGLGWVGDNRGLLWVERASGPEYRLNYSPRAGGAPVALGSWKTAYFQGRRGYTRDKHGCLVLHNRQEAGHQGTYLRRLPR